MKYKNCIVYVMLFFCARSIFCLQENYVIKVCVGNDAAPFCESIAKLTVQGFSQYPYLFPLNFDQEMQSIFSWMKTEDSAVALLLYKDEVVGCMRGSARCDYGEKHYYITALVIDEKHRGKHLSVLLLQSLENFAQSLGYEICCLKTEKSMHQNAFWPAGYKDRDYSFAGYYKCGIELVEIWPTLQPDGSVIFQEHVLISWKKKLH